MCIGSLGATGRGRRRSRRPRPAAPVPARLAGWLRVNLLLLRLRAQAFLRRIPLDLYAYERPERLRRFDQREPLLVLLDRDGRLAAALSAAGRALAVSRSGPRRAAPAGPTRPAATSPSWNAPPPASRFTDRFDVTFAGGRPPREPPRRTYLVCHPRRSLWRTLRNARALPPDRRCASARAWSISTGADVAVPICLLGRLLGARLIFIETAGELAPTLAGRLVYPFADLFIVQWPEKLAAFPRAVLPPGPLL